MEWQIGMPATSANADVHVSPARLFVLKLAARPCGTYGRYTMELEEQLLQQDVVE